MKFSHTKSFPLIFLILLPGFRICAQNLSGNWNGKLFQNDKSWSFTMETTIIQAGNELKGTSKYTAYDGSYVVHNFIGTFTGKKISLQETSVKEEHSGNTYSWCIKLMEGIVSAENGIMRITGPWKNDGYKGYHAGKYFNNASYSCPPGTFMISKEASCGDIIFNSLIVDMDAWKRKDEFEKTNDWEKRTSNLNTERKKNELINKYGKPYLNTSQLDIEYNADTEEFYIASSCVEKFILKVPLAYAKCFKEKFIQSDIADLVLGFDEEKKILIVKNVSIKSPCDSKKYTTGNIQAPASSNNTNISIAPAKSDTTDYFTRPFSTQKELEVSSDEIAIRLYDNAEVDGDSVTLLINNTALLKNVRLTDKPIELKIKNLKTSGNNSIVMFAENEGSIPPNTALLIVKDGKKEHKIFLSSSKQKSGQVIIRYNGRNP